MPFGLTNAPATFQWLMETCLGDINLNWCIIYLNDIVIFSNDPASHCMRQEAVFQKLKQARLKLKSSKCKLFCRQITYLGHIVSAQGVATDEEKISVIKKCPMPPLSLRSRASWGSPGYYHQFVPQFAQIASLCMQCCLVKTPVKRRQPSLGMTDANSPLMNWSAYVPQHLFLPMLTLSGP